MASRNVTNAKGLGWAQLLEGGLFRGWVYRFTLTLECGHQRGWVTDASPSRGEVREPGWVDCTECDKEGT